METRSPKIGFLSTWNQECGLATYANFLLENYPQGQVVILAEDVEPSAIKKVDEPNVVRCWRRLTNDFSRFEQAIVSNQIEVLHLNSQFSFFDCNQLGIFLNRLRSKGVKVVSQVHNPSTLNRNLQALIQASDKVIVHTPENKNEAIANGANPEAVEVIEHGVKAAAHFDKVAARNRVAIPHQQKAVVTFGFVRQHKGIHGVIEALAQLLNSPSAKERYQDVHLYIVGNSHIEDPEGIRYVEYLNQLAATLGVSDRVHFSASFVPDELVQEYLVAADAVVLNYQTDWYEASGALALALGSHAPIITSLAPPFHRLGSAVFHATTGFPLAHAIDLVLHNSSLASSLRKEASSWATKYSWEAVSKDFLSLYRSISDTAVEKDAPSLAAPQQTAPAIVSSTGSNLRILMQNRPNALTQRGGDTVLMEKVTEHLRTRGVDVDIDVTGAVDIKKYDLVHLYNFAIREVTERLARNCKANGVPYVVTALYEDWPVFFSQMDLAWRAVASYVEAGQPREAWGDLERQIQQAKPTAAWDNTWTAHNAEAILASGKYEAMSLRRDYPLAKRIELYNSGCDISDEAVDGNLFRQETGITEDFILCVGRLETRKNQLMLLKALEDSDISIVFATGGFTYQQEYANYCQAFKRRGKTHFVGRLDSNLLRSAYVAAKAHVLPSWFELPGIVSLEAGRLGTNVVATKYGTAEDYLGDMAFYCDPDNTLSIRTAVEQAFSQDVTPGLVEKIKQITWEKSAERHIEVYSNVLRGKEASDKAPKELAPTMGQINEASTKANEASQTVQAIPHTVGTIAVNPEKQREVDELCKRGDELLKSGDRAQARSLYERAIHLVPSSSRAHRSFGVWFLSVNQIDSAEREFQQAVAFDASDFKSILGLGQCCYQRGAKERAFELYCKAAELQPSETAVIAHLVGVSYELEKFAELEKVLRRAIVDHRVNLDLQYCLAGCYFKQKKLSLAASIVAQILMLDPGRADALELQAKIKESEDKNFSVEPGYSTDYPSAEYSQTVARKILQLEEAKADKRFEEVVREADDVIDSPIASRGERALATILKAESLALVGEVDAAKEQFLAMISDDYYGARAWVGIGALEANVEKWAEARECFDKAIAVNQEIDSAYAGLGVCAMKLGEYEQSWQSYSKALELNPENSRGLTGLVQLAYQMSRLPELEKALGLYLELKPVDFEIMYSYAGCLFAQGKLEESKAQLQKILLFESGNERALELLQKIDKNSTEKASANAGD